VAYPEASVSSQNVLLGQAAQGWGGHYELLDFLKGLLLGFGSSPGLYFLGELV